MRLSEMGVGLVSQRMPCGPGWEQGRRYQSGSIALVVGVGLSCACVLACACSGLTGEAQHACRQIFMGERSARKPFDALRKRSKITAAPRARSADLRGRCRKR